MTRRALVLLLLATGCGGGAASGARVFAPEWQNDGGKSIQAVYDRVHAAPVEAGPGLAVGVTESGLVGMGLDGSGSWKFAGQLDAAPGAQRRGGGGQHPPPGRRSGREIRKTAVAGTECRAVPCAAPATTAR